MDYKGYRNPANRNSKKQIELSSNQPEIHTESAENSMEPAATEQAATESASTEPPKDDPFKKLKRAVGSKVIEKSDLIAKSLIDATIAGNSNSARIVVGLVDKRPKNKAKLKKLKKAALSHKSSVQKAIELRDGPDWKDEDEAKPAGDPPALSGIPALPEKEDSR